VVAPPPFLQLAAHPVRWGLLRALSGGDLRVGELTALAGERQSLVSYHLRLLREGELVRAHRSAADGRDTYYTLDLERCRALLAGTGAALHPGLAAAEPPRALDADVLFLCTGNSARSQMAEALAEGKVRAYSAGSRPKPLHPEAVRVMAARGIDIAGRRSKHLDEFADRRFDRVITLCDKVREVCPEYEQAAHWSIREPVEPEDFDRCADELETRIGFLVRAIDAGGA
jgi:protein-tyrosine-phosphatase/DNA-binding transcriptional ArsR family regulator